MRGSVTFFPGLTKTTICCVQALHELFSWRQLVWPQVLPHLFLTFPTHYSAILSTATARRIIQSTLSWCSLWSVLIKQSRVFLWKKKKKLRLLISVMWHATSLEKSRLVIVRKKSRFLLSPWGCETYFKGVLLTCKLLPMQCKVQLMKQCRWSKFLLVRIARCEGQHFWQLITKSRLKNKHTTSSWSQRIFQFCICCWFRSRSSSTPFIVMFSIEF